MNNTERLDKMLVSFANVHTISNEDLDEMLEREIEARYPSNDEGWDARLNDGEECDDDCGGD